MPETELLYMQDVEANYIRDFEARVVEVAPGQVVLDRTAFYPAGGGQPSDTGTLQFDGSSIRVRQVDKRGQVRHLTDGDLPPRVERVRGVLDWAPRFAHMRMHTAQHVLSGVVFDLFKARTVGNQIHADRSRIDFLPASFSPIDLASIERKVNDLLSQGASVSIFEEDRSEVERKVDSLRANLDLLPASARRLRMVRVGDFDLCPCAGTHVRNTSEIGLLKISGRENKGRDRERVSYTLERPA